MRGRLAVLIFVAASGWACDGRDGTLPAASAVVSPTGVRQREDGDAQILPPIESGEIVAYVSRAEQRIYVSRDFRDRAQNLLNAHISVSTGHWRIPLPGDSPSEPLIQGVPQREFEEFAVDDLDADMEPSVGDFRVLVGGYVPLSIGLECVLDEDGSVYVVAGSMAAMVGARAAAGIVREDFLVVGEVGLFEGPSCLERTATKRAVMWVAQEH